MNPPIYIYTQFLKKHIEIPTFTLPETNTLPQKNGCLEYDPAS